VVLEVEPEGHVVPGLEALGAQGLCPDPVELRDAAGGATNALEQFAERERSSRTRGVEGARSALLGAVQRPGREVTGVDQLDGLVAVGGGADLFACREFAHPEAEAVGGVVGADQQAGADQA
jgi:hypothetical protein